MSCFWCTHFVKDKERSSYKACSSWASMDGMNGECAIHPQRLAVNGDHYCSQLRLRDAGDVLRYRQMAERNQIERDFFEKEYKKAKKLSVERFHKIREMKRLEKADATE